VDDGVSGMSEDVLTQDLPAERLELIDTFLGTLIAPVQTFKQLSLECRDDIKHLPGAFGIVVLVFALDALRLTPASEIGWAVLNVPFEVTGGLLLWLLSAFVVSLCALCFGASAARVRSAFVTLGWSLLPWIFMAPLSCFWKVSGPAHFLLMALPLVWVFFLQIVAIMQSFEMKSWQVLVLVLLVPPLLSWYQCMQFIQSLIVTLGSICS
jgi:hypothetical protein